MAVSLTPEGCKVAEEYLEAVKYDIKERSAEEYLGSMLANLAKKEQCEAELSRHGALAEKQLSDDASRHTIAG